MKKPNWINLGCALIAASLGLASVHATAADIVLEGGGITITETALGSDQGEYIVENFSSLTLFGFAVSNNFTSSVESDFVNASDGEGILWDASIIEEGDWATFEIIDVMFNSILLGSFGAFTDFFETGDSVNLYSIGETGVINPGATVGGDFGAAFIFNPGLLESSAVVFGSGSGGNSAVAVTSAVPVPAAVWLFASGIVGLAGVARRKTL